jgi:tetratricopeptide (TPR) repeat protein
VEEQGGKEGRLKFTALVCTLHRGLSVTAAATLADLRRAEPAADVLVQRAEDSAKAGQAAEAAAWYGRVLAAPIPARVDPYDDALRFLVTATDPAHRDPVRAAALAEALIAHTFGRDARACYTLALARRQLGQRAEAERACLAALALRPGHPTLLATLAEIRAMP